MAFRGSELHNSGEQGRLEYSEEVDQAGNENDRGTNNRVHDDASELQSDESDYMKDKKKALVSSPRVHEASDLPSDESDNLKNPKALLFFLSSSRVLDAPDLPSDESDDMKKKKPLARMHDASELPSDQSDDMKKKKPLARARDWSELPRDISNLIGDKMRFFPHLQMFGAASKEWRGIACELIETLASKIKSEPPMLLLPYNRETEIATFFDMENSKTYDMKMPELKDQWICGTSNGWLAMIDNNLDLSLFNTVTRARVKLPPLHPFGIEWFHNNCNVTNIPDRYNIIKKVALCGDPSSSECLVAVIYPNLDCLNVCLLGDEDWSMEMNDRLRGYLEIIFYQGNIFAVREYFFIHVFEYDEEDGLRIIKKIKTPYIDDEWRSSMKYLVESNGDLFHIRSVGIPGKPLGFEVFKFEPMSKEKEPWSRVYSLGDRSMFLGLNACICMSVKEFPWCKPNCIYFTNDRYRFRFDDYEWENGVYSLEENRVIARFDIQHPVSIWDSPAIWYRPKV